MENKLEELLNKLIEKGWKPFGKRNKLYAVENGIYILGRIANDWNTYDLRQIVSKESGLWQFVCENNLNYSEDDSIYNVWLKHYAEDDHESPYTYASPVWYFIESSLKDESELGDFLLQNIKVDG